jgi:hypothetical protein
MKRVLLATAGVCLFLFACDKAPDVKATGELRANRPTPAQAADQAKTAALAPPAEITNGADIKNPAAAKGITNGADFTMKNPVSQKVAPVGGGMNASPQLDNAQKGLSR